jgi:hypothetical protein
MIFFCLYVENSTCYVGFNFTMRRHWMTFLVEKCNIGHFCITDIFFMQFSYFLWKSKVIVILWYMTKKTYFSYFIYFFIIKYGIFHTREFRYLTSRMIKFTHWTILTDVFKYSTIFQIVVLNNLSSQKDYYIIFWLLTENFLITYLSSVFTLSLIVHQLWQNFTL